jgi:hypothetical protein
MTATRARDPRPGDVAWMAAGACLNRDDLPWIADPEHTTALDLLAMGALCKDCPARPDCSSYATGEKVSAGFWAGTHRDSGAPKLFAGPGWAAQTLPGLASLGGVA